jgi:glutathione S-transferase
MCDLSPTSLSRCKFLLFNADYCPLGQRGWITLLEKKVEFKLVEVNAFNRSLDMTKLFLEVSPSGQFPGGVHNGKILFNDLALCKYLDEMFPHNSLFPGTPYSRWEANMLLVKINTELVPLFYKVLECKSPQKAKAHQSSLLELLKYFNNQLAKSGGPWLIGEQFTIVDISLLTYAERMVVLFPHLNDFEIPKTEEYCLFHNWMQKGFQRDSFKVTSANRSEQSMKTHPFKAITRAEYLREVYGHATANGRQPENLLSKVNEGVQRESPTPRTAV